MCRRDSVNDERALWLHRLKTLLPARTLPLLYPRLFALGALLRDPSIASAEPELPPAIIYLSAAKLADDGIFLLENGFEAYIHFGPRVEPELLMALAGGRQSLDPKFTASNFPSMSPYVFQRRHCCQVQGSCQC